MSALQNVAGQIPARCGSSLEKQPIISKFGHGGPRENSGGPRPGAGRPPRIEPEWSEPIPLGRRWYCYATHPQAEGLAARELSRTGYRSYAPLIADRRRDRVIPSMWHQVLVSRFVGYGFVELGATEPWLPIHRDTPGVRALLLTASGRPQPLPVGEIEAHQADDERLAQLRPEIMPQIAPGTLVEIHDGVFAGHGAMVVACSGVMTQVEVAMCGRLLQVGLPRRWVAEVPANNG